MIRNDLLRACQNCGLPDGARQYDRCILAAKMVQGRGWAIDFAHPVGAILLIGRLLS